MNLKLAITQKDIDTALLLIASGELRTRTCPVSLAAIRALGRPLKSAAGLLFEDNEGEPIISKKHLRMERFQEDFDAGVPVHPTQFLVRMVK